MSVAHDISMCIQKAFFFFFKFASVDIYLNLFIVKLCVNKTNGLGHVSWKGIYKDSIIRIFFSYNTSRLCMCGIKMFSVLFLNIDVTSTVLHVQSNSSWLCLRIAPRLKSFLS